MNPFDIKNFKIVPKENSAAKISINIKREIVGPFLKGPIPLHWLERAAQLGGKALHVGISLWFLKGVTGSNTVRFNQNRQGRYGVKRDAARRGLKKLEGNGLIKVNRKNGRSLEVVINETLEEESNVEETV
jgi:hypothetical protein